MLRIHIEHEPEGTRLRLEGKLVQTWVDEAIRVWMELTISLPSQTPISVDLSEVSFVDARGKALLFSMLKSGCTLHGSGLFIPKVIEDLRSSLPSRPSGSQRSGSTPATGSSHPDESGSGWMPRPSTPA